MPYIAGYRHDASAAVITKQKIPVTRVSQRIKQVRRFPDRTVSGDVPVSGPLNPLYFQRIKFCGIHDQSLKCYQFFYWNVL
jgi:hypothetical protein